MYKANDQVQATVYGTTQTFTVIKDQESEGIVWVQSKTGTKRFLNAESIISQPTPEHKRAVKGLLNHADRLLTTGQTVTGHADGWPFKIELIHGKPCYMAATASDPTKFVWTYEAEAYETIISQAKQT